MTVGTGGPEGAPHNSRVATALAWAVQGRSGRRRAWTAAIAWPLAGGAAVTMLMRLFGLEDGVRPVQLTAFTPYLALGAMVAAVAVGLTRRPVAAVVATLAAIVLIACVAPRAIGSPTNQDGTPLVVMAVNLRLGGAEARSIMDLVAGAGVDVLALQELTAEAEASLLDAGLADLLPFRESHPGPGAVGSALYSRLPLAGGGVRRASDPGFNQAYATVALPGDARVIVESVHPVPPIGQVDRWETGLRNQVRGDAPGLPRILAGDFNATLDHRAMRDVLATGYRDVADAVGAGLTPTWPFYGRRSLVTPRITIDHVLVPEGIVVRDFRAVTIPLTDHRAIVATVVIPD